MPPPPRPSTPQRRVAVVLSAVNLQRLLPGMSSFVEAGRDYWLIDIYRPWEDLERLLRRWKPAGLITEWIPLVTERLLALALPTVVAPYDLAREGVAAVDVDDAAIGRMAADYFLSRSLPHLAFLGNGNAYSAQRGEAFAARGEEHGFTVATFHHDHRRPRQYIEHWPASTSEMLQWIGHLPKPCGLFVAHDPLARSVAESCRDAGIAIPQELAILGVNDDPLVCKMTNPHLSSIALPWAKVGYEVGARMEALLRQPAQRQWPQVLVSPSAPVTRHSTERTSTEHPTLLRVLAHIREHACTGVRVADVARETGVSRRTLERLFRDELGSSPRDEILRHRLERARLLLRETDLSMPLVAERAGFSNGEVFCVNFRRQARETPTAYRRRYRLD
jgi:LacI family transcriptional regulator